MSVTEELWHSSVSASNFQLTSSHHETFHCCINQLLALCRRWCQWFVWIRSN